jgi:hypothetical protein
MKPRLVKLVKHLLFLFQSFIAFLSQSYNPILQHPSSFLS